MVYTMTVGHKDADLIGNDNSAIQAAVDRVAGLGGGIVKILPGTYRMNDSLHLRSNVAVQGSGEETVLWKPASVSSKILHFLGYGHYDISVAEPEKFEVGMGIHISDDNSVGFYDTVATIKWKKGQELGITRMLNHDIHEDYHAKAVSVYPIISGYHLKNASICDLVIDGNAAENEYLNGCRGGGIFLLQAHDVRISNVTVRNYNGDGISFQQCKRTVIEGCTCINNTGHGLHPGSGSVGSILRNTVSRGNGRDGIFYCLRVSFALCENCTLEGNGQDGISIGHRDSDTIIRNNRISGNGRYGIYIREDSLNFSGYRNMLTGNYIGGNCRNGGRGEIFIDSVVEDLQIVKNTFDLKNHSENNNPATAIYVNDPPISLTIHQNEIGEGLLFEVAQEDFKKGISLSAPLKELKIGPEAASPSDYAHLE